MSMEIYDCIIVGGGPAGLNAAIVLGRCRRKVLIFDTEQYRNRYSHGIHNYLTRDDILPHDFLQLCQKELEKYYSKAQLYDFNLIYCDGVVKNVFEAISKLNGL